MPGLVGFTLKNATGQDSSCKAADAMLEMLKHRAFYKKEPVFYDGFICASRIHLNLQQVYKQPYLCDGVYVWLEGEFYNQPELNAMFKIKGINDSDILGKLYLQDRNLKFLSEIDGHYAAVIYDPSAAELHLITDRYGLRYLFYSMQNGCLAWASEVKAFLAYPGFDPVIDPETVNEFFEYQHMIKDKTWLKDVRLLNSGTVLTWNLKRCEMRERRYWWWTQIQPLKGPINVDEVIEELSIRFKRAVTDRCREGSKVGLTLSGGLDSRAIIAAMPQEDTPIIAATFGRPNCPDIRIARQVAAVKNAKHVVFELKPDNWLSPRFEGIWLTDGHKTLVDMHFVDTSESLSKYVSYSLDGYLGDAVLGGGYQPGHLGYQNWNELEKIDNRGRRFIAEGGRLGNAFLIFDRYPFFNNALMELSYAIPAEYRKDSALYNQMLLKTFPKFFERIPWQKTLMPIGKPSIFDYSKQFGLWFLWKGNGACRRLGLPHMKRNRGYAEYDKWLRAEPARSQIENILKRKDALYPQYIKKETVLSELNRHIAGEDRTRILCLYVTFEIWLQQVFNRKMRCRYE